MRHSVLIICKFARIYFEAVQCEVCCLPSAGASFMCGMHLRGRQRESPRPDYRKFPLRMEFFQQHLGLDRQGVSAVDISRCQSLASLLQEFPDLSGCFGILIGQLSVDPFNCRSVAKIKASVC